MCEACGLIGHHYSVCQSSQEHVNAFQTFRQQNPAAFSWTNNNNVANPHQQYTPPTPPQNPPYVPPGRNFQSQSKPYQSNYQRPSFTPSTTFTPPTPSATPTPPADEWAEMKALLKQSIANQAKTEAQVAQLAAHNKMLENQVSQLASSSSSRPAGNFPSQGKQSHETCNAITLQSGTSYEGPSMPVELVGEDATGKDDKVGDEKNVEEVDSDKVIVENDEDTTPVQKDTRPIKVYTRRVKPVSDTVDSTPIAKATPVEKPIIQLPFPDRQRKTKLNTQFGKFMDVVKNLQVTVPFTELITQVPSYAKFMKDILTRKRSIGDVETVAFTETTSAFLQSKTPPKKADPGSFSISCTIGTTFIDKALCDLGASVSVMPYSVYEKLNMGNLKCTSVTLQMADRSVRRPVGILEDMPVKIGKFFIPVDFIVLDMAEDLHIPIILGRPFLHTAGAVIDVKNGSLTLEVGDDKTTFHLTNAFRSPMVEEQVYSINVIEENLCLDTCAGTARDWDAEIDALEAALYKGEHKEEKAMIHMDSLPPSDTFEFEFFTVPSLLNDAYLVKSDCYNFSRSKLVVFEKHHTPAHVEFSKVLHDDCFSFSTDSGRPPDCNVMPLENMSFESDRVQSYELPALSRLDSMQPSPTGLVGWVCLCESFAANSTRVKQLTKFFSAVYVLLWCYLQFSVAHAQMFDRLLRALSCFDWA